MDMRRKVNKCRIKGDLYVPKGCWATAVRQWTIATHCSGRTSCQGCDGGHGSKVPVLAPRRFLRHIVENVQKDL